MKIMKLSSIFLLSMFFIWIFMPEAHAKHHCRGRSSFGLSFNFGGGPSYLVAPTPVVAAAPVYAYPGYVTPAPVAPVYTYPGYVAPVIVPRPITRMYVQPGFSYSYLRY
jgi:hypothetical protein